MHRATFSTDDGGKSGIGGRNGLTGSQSRRGGDAVSETNRGEPTVVASGAKSPSLDGQLVGDRKHIHTGLAEQGEISLNRVRIAAKDPAHLVTDLGSIDRRELSGSAQ